MTWSGVPNRDQLLTKYWSHGTEQRFLQALSSRTWSLLEWRRFANSLSKRWRSRAGRQNGRWHVNITSYKKDFYGRFPTSPLCSAIKPRMPYQSSRERNKCVLTAACLLHICRREYRTGKQTAHIPVQHNTGLFYFNCLSLHICCIFRSVLRPYSGTAIQKPYKGRYDRNLRGPFLYSH